MPGFAQAAANLGAKTVAPATAEAEARNSAGADGHGTQGTDPPSPEPPPATPDKSLPRIVLPRAISIPVAYPEQENEAARVLLEITVGSDGNVTDPKLLDGREPFASAALSAARSWRFVPAQRDNVPVTARIRFAVNFTPDAPQHAIVGSSEPAQNKLPNAAGAGGQPKRKHQPQENTAKTIEVTVEGERPDAAVVSMGRADVEQMPGAFGDPFRAIDSLPGVVPMVSGLPFFFIRGAPPGNQGYFLDAIRVPLLYHMAVGPGVIHPALVDRVDLYAGGYPARFGRFAGAIIAGESRDPAPEYHAQASVRLVDSGGYVTAPLGRGVVAMGGRYSYTAAVVSLIAPQIKIDYWDYQAKVVQYLSDRDTLGIFAFGSLDLVQDKSSDSPDAYLGTEFHRFDVRYSHSFGAATRLRSAITFGLDKTLAAAALTVRDQLASVRSDLEHHLASGATLRAGADAALDHYDVVIPVPDGSNSRLRQGIPERDDVVAGAWLDVAFTPGRRVTLVPGLRFDHYWSRDERAWAIEPRVSAIFSISSGLRLVHALGLAHQPPSFIVPIPGFQLSGLKAGLQRSLQSSAGIELDLPKEIQFSTTLFQNAFFNLTDQLSVMNRPNSSSDELDPSIRSRGRTFGAEVMIRRSFTQRIGGLLAYTLSKSWRTTDGIRIPAAFDRRHVIQAALAFNLGRNWRSSARAMFYSGTPSRNDRDQDFDRATGVPNATPERNPERLPRAPAYYRFDLRLQKRWPVGSRGAFWAVTFEVLNATLNRETIEQTCSVSSCKTERIGPITLPSIGVEASY
ncbi:MAG: TonB-dependent receptor domain-containing protein [Myxococcales bacterium]